MISMGWVGGRNEESCFNEYRVLVWGNEAFYKWTEIIASKSECTKHL
jgi:hypothetical protein